MLDTQQYKDIQKFITEKIAPGILSHGGDIKISKLANNILELQLSGACGSCSVQAYTAESIADFLLEEFADLEDVIVSDIDLS